jgi:hypothetical protein
MDHSPGLPRHKCGELISKITKAKGLGVWLKWRACLASMRPSSNPITPKRDRDRERGRKREGEREKNRERERKEKVLTSYSMYPVITSPLERGFQDRNLCSFYSVLYFQHLQ